MRPLSGCDAEVLLTAYDEDFYSDLALPCPGLGLSVKGEEKMSRTTQLGHEESTRL